MFRKIKLGRKKPGEGDTFQVPFLPLVNNKEIAKFAEGLPAHAAGGDPPLGRGYRDGCEASFSGGHSGCKCGPFGADAGGKRLVFYITAGKSFSVLA